jgi:K+-sensing histidine kinase KdpD
MQLLGKTRTANTILHFTVKKLINLDQNLIKNSIINLITNAIKYSSGNLLYFTTEINDTHCIIKGIGIQKKISHIYLSLFRA